MIMQPFKREFEGRNIPPSIKKHIFDKKYRVDEIGKSGSSVLCFDNMVLKIEKQSEEADNEMSMLKWLYGRLPVPEIIEFSEDDLEDESERNEGQEETNKALREVVHRGE